MLSKNAYIIPRRDLFEGSFAQRELVLLLFFFPFTSGSRGIDWHFAEPATTEKFGTAEPSEETVMWGEHAIYSFFAVFCVIIFSFCDQV